MGPGEEAPPTEEGEWTRAFKEDRATPGRPQVYRVSAGAIDGKREDVPVEVAELMAETRFYWLELPISLWTRPNWGFNRLEVKAEFAAGPDGPAPTTFYVLPDEVLVTYFEGNELLSLGIDARLKARAALPPVAAGQPGGPELEFDAAGGGAAKVKTRYLIGPLHYKLTARKVRHSQPGLDHVFWRLDSARYANEGDPGLRVMLRVPHEAEELKAKVLVRAERYPTMLEGRLQEKIAQLPAKLASFFSKGTPVGGSQSFDLSKELQDDGSE
jgi:hypothetical protein